ncbi:MotA/TolQ/ExbB proton channel family protein [Cocleimonas flava]|jgi:biopolymer transport protein ExbB|uniref:Biopolymer transport protein ExbB n=1 Tax=Cocleimonas flava TaxID=634765 RepID=A0A4R1F479_9GAMM|nr:MULTISPECIES: MotA/TolQ/ExbB proton channel family protein [Cocleimonas]MEB8431847.1 MotA/TolQ/ExbB proton channel family protein [Cocleimonas sp. KMM 6892]MEC4715067.1 MotA/TolQ/ExbB proton channel family protein [Cocleimonas sp. KMM 6895]MEC4744119.1 MotA/TolQ/ExbB proton channel family protein [Cocleimonas sp. KMM 6896]TCJ87289.1 biopolymer transport protein ExbB [Cocleimonas flava]
MDTFVQAGGWLMIPLVLSSLVAIAVILALFMTLKKDKVIPDGLAEKAQKLAKSGKMTQGHIDQIEHGSLLGRVLATGLQSLGQPRHVMKENIEEAGRHAIHKMDKYMTTLGTIAAIAPLLGLLGTVVGMIVVFNEMLRQGGVGNPADLAGGISQALVTTAFGITIAVPALIFHRYFRGKINDYAIEMEQQAIKLLEVVSIPNRRATDMSAKPAAKRQRPAAQAVSAGRVA